MSYKSTDSHVLEVLKVSVKFKVFVLIHLQKLRLLMSLVYLFKLIFQICLGLNLHYLTSSLVEIQKWIWGRFFKLWHALVPFRHCPFHLPLPYISKFLVFVQVFRQELKMKLIFERGLNVLKIFIYLILSHPSVLSIPVFVTIFFHKTYFSLILVNLYLIYRHYLLFVWLQVFFQLLHSFYLQLVASN